MMKSLLLGCVNKLTIPLTDKERTWVRSPLINKLKNKNHNISIDVGKDLEKFQHLGSLLVQWLRVHLAIQGTLVSSLIREDPTSHRTTNKPMCPNY